MHFLANTAAGSGLSPSGIPIRCATSWSKSPARQPHELGSVNPASVNATSLPVTFPIRSAPHAQPPIVIFFWLARKDSCPYSPPLRQLYVVELICFFLFAPYATR